MDEKRISKKGKEKQERNSLQQRSSEKRQILENDLSRNK